MKDLKIVNNFWFAVIIIAFSSCEETQENDKQKPLVIQEQGSFAVGGNVITNPGIFDPYNPAPEGQTFHGDHAYVFCQIPAKARNRHSRQYPLPVFGFEQCRNCRPHVRIS
jgi:hypothetical protein